MKKAAGKKKWPIVVGVIVLVLAIVAGNVWSMAAPVLGFGDLSDTISAKDISSAREKFTTGVYQDAETGLTLPYSIYTPEGYDPSQSYPLVVYIADSGSVSEKVETPLERNFGGAVWATDSEQEKHPCFVVVPCYPEIILDDHGEHTMTEYVELTARMIEQFKQDYSIDRVYGTGQSMGAMTTMYLAANHPDLYTAVLLVDGQWNIAELEGLKDTKFIYISAAGDEKAYAGQQEVIDMFDAAGIAYGEVTEVNASAKVSLLNAVLEATLAKGYEQNFITWRFGTVGKFPGDEHMPSFRFGYKSDVVRDWLFAQE